MQVNKVEDYYTVSNEHYWVKTIHPHVTFTTSEHDVLHCITREEAEAVKEYIGEHFAF